MTARTVDFDEFSRRYDSLRGTARERLLPWVSEIADYAPISQADSMVDIGCGTGRYTELFSEFCGAVTGLDKSSGMLSEAVRSHIRGASYVRGNATSLPYGGGTFDCAVMIMVVHNFGREERRVLFGEARRVLKENGRIVIVTNSHARMRRSLWRYFPGFLEIDFGRFPNLRELENDLRLEGFRTGHKAVKKRLGTIRTEEYLRKVNGRYVSTLSLMDEDTFRRGIDVFSSKIREIYPVSMPDEQEFMLVKGTVV